jgi:CelD/BcsL family acetyltransferase involved in cellulose biosynthesis
VVEDDDVPVIALPFVGVGPALLRAATVPGSYWPFRSFPIHQGAETRAVDALLDTLARTINALRIGPVCDGDPALDAVLARARAKGWAVLDRFVADSFLLDLQQDDWPRGSTLRKNRFHEKHLASHGALDWGYLDDDWERGFDDLAAVEQKSWIAARTDGSDAKFTRTGHGAFWREVARDPVLAHMLSAAVLRIDGVPAAFSFDLDSGTTRYAIANSYDPAFAKHSPGKLLYYRNLVRARAAGIRSVDWGAGDSGYKQTIGATPGPALRDWLLVRPGLPALLGRMLQGRWAASGNPAT